MNHRQRQMKMRHQQFKMIPQLRMWDMSALIRRCEIFGLFYSFCSQLVVDAESQTRDQDVGRHVDVRTIPILEGLLLW